MQYEEPIFLIPNLEQAYAACRYYRRRFRIETFFSDQKSRGFNIPKSHLADLTRLSRLLIAACLAYIWMIPQGLRVIAENKLSLIDTFRASNVAIKASSAWALIGSSMR